MTIRVESCLAELLYLLCLLRMFCLAKGTVGLFFSPGSKLLVHGQAVW